MGVRGARRVVPALAVVMALLASGCAKKTARPISQSLAIDPALAAKGDGPGVPPINVVGTCGSNSTTFGTELLTTSPANAKVTKEWGQIIPPDRQMFVSGTVRDFQFSTGDLTFDHPFGTDVTFDVKPDIPLRWLAQRLGEGSDADGPSGGLLHSELERGLWPHQGRDYLPGFIPQNGDRVAEFGRWIVDCGHADYHTEIHPITFFAVARTDGSATVSHAFYDPYYVTQLYTPDATQSANFSNPARLTDPTSKTFPSYLVYQLKDLIGIGSGAKLNQLEAHVLEGANTASPITWFVCAPGGKTGKATVSYQYTVRPGVKLTVGADDSNGCAKFTALIDSTYTPAPLVRRDCVDPWAELNQQAQAATGNPDLDILKAIQAQVPPQFAGRVARDPVVDCYDDLQAPPPGGGAEGNAVVTDANQPYPFYGSARVSVG